MAKINLTILGDPKAQKRHRSFRRGSHIGQYDPSQTDKKDLLAIVQENAPEQPLVGPLSLTVCFFMARPQAHFRTGKYAGELKESSPLFHGSTPDVDNLTKLILDALNSVFWQDDRQVAKLSAMKIYDGKPRTEILIETLTETK